MNRSSPALSWFLPPIFVIVRTCLLSCLLAFRKGRIPITTTRHHGARGSSAEQGTRHVPVCARGFAAKPKSIAGTPTVALGGAVVVWHGVFRSWNRDTI